MKIMYVCPKAPWPVLRGDQRIAWEQIRHLSGSGTDLHLVCIVSSSKEAEEARERVAVFCKSFDTIQSSFWRSATSVVRSLWNHRPMQVNYYSTPNTEKKLRKIVAEIKPDLIHIQTVRLAPAFLGLETPKVLDMIDRLSLNMERRCEIEKGLRKPLLILEAFLMKKYEKKMFCEFKAISMVSKRDISPDWGKKLFVNPNGTALKEERPEVEKGAREEVLLFHGNMSYFPNEQAMLFFLDRVWPQVRERLPDYQLWIVGTNPSKQLKKRHGHHRVHVIGFVEDVTLFLRRARIGVYPMRAGSGMQNKILEAMALGLPSVVFPMAIQGMESIPEGALLVAHSPDEMVEKIVRLAEDSDLREAIACRAQSYVADTYTWEKNIERLREIWRWALETKHNTEENE